MIPTSDPLSFTIPGELWLNVNWLGALIWYGSYVLGGFTGVVALKMVVGCLWHIGCCCHHRW